MTTRDEVINAAKESGVFLYGPTPMCPSRHEPFIDSCQQLYDIAFNAGLERAADICNQSKEFELADMLREVMRK